MLKLAMTTFAVALALNIMPAMAQQTPPDTAQQETSIIGLPIYSSDGEKLGEVTQVGLHEGQRAVVAQLEASLGEGAMVLIPTEIMTQQGDHLELPMTVEEVKNTLSKP
jgi:sporulation protein YlmC with PRC-barrel domain